MNLKDVIDPSLLSQLEERTDCKISVFGKTVGIIGHQNDIENAKRAVEDILSGARFENVWRSLSKRRADERETEW